MSSDAEELSDLRTAVAFQERQIAMVSAALEEREAELAAAVRSSAAELAAAVRTIGERDETIRELTAAAAGGAKKAGGGKQASAAKKVAAERKRKGPDPPPARCFSRDEAAASSGAAAVPAAGAAAAAGGSGEGELSARRSKRAKITRELVGERLWMMFDDEQWHQGEVEERIFVSGQPALKIKFDDGVFCPRVQWTCTDPAREEGTHHGVCAHIRRFQFYPPSSWAGDGGGGGGGQEAATATAKQAHAAPKVKREPRCSIASFFGKQGASKDEPLELTTSPPRS